MPRNNIKELLANNQATLDLAFNNLLLIANVINNRELLKWVEREISGYSENDVLPVYRRNEKSMHFIYSGLNGTYPINNAPMPISFFPENIRDTVVNFKILEGVKIIERQVSVKDAEWTVTKDCTEYAADVYKNTGIQCFNISQILQKSHYEKVYDIVKFHLMKILMMIEKWFGTLDTVELGAKKFEKQRVLEAAKDISAYVANLHKPTIPAPRISMPPQPVVRDNKNPEQVMQQPMYQPQQPMYQPQQPVYQPQQQPLTYQQPAYQPPQSQQPAYQPAQPQQPQQPAYQQPQQPAYQPQPQQPAYPPKELSYPILPSSIENIENGQLLSEQKPKINEPDKKPLESKPVEFSEPPVESVKQPAESVKPPVESPVESSVESPKAKQEVKEGTISENESNSEAAKAKAAEIRKDRVPKSLLDYLEEKKSELNKKTE